MAAGGVAGIAPAAQSAAQQGNFPDRLSDVSANATLAAYATVRNIWEIFTAKEITTIKKGENNLNLTSKVQAAMTANPNSAWFWPAGHYFLDGNVALALPEGISWLGAGIGKTIIKVGITPWGLEQANPKGVEQREGFQARGIDFLFSNNGIRLNTARGGYDDTLATQRYIMRPVFESCRIKQNSATAGLIGLQLNKCFNVALRDNIFEGFAVQLDCEGSDMVALQGANRFDNASDGAILAQSHGTFGTNLIVGQGTDINQPKHFGIRSNYRKIVISGIHGELDSPRGSTGTGGNMEAFIDIIAGGGGAFHVTITHNLLAVGQFCDKWLRYRGDNPYSVYVVDNSSPGLMGGVDFGIGLPYFANGPGNRVTCVHHGNYEGEPSFPMNSMPADFYAGIAHGALLSAGRPGITNAAGLGAVNFGVKCASGDVIVAPIADTGKFIEWSNWSGWPANNLIGTFSVNVSTYASVANQVLSWRLLDGTKVLASGTITHAVANRIYVTALAVSQAFSTRAKLQIWNADTAHRGTVYFRTGEFT